MNPQELEAKRQELKAKYKIGMPTASVNTIDVVRQRREALKEKGFFADIKGIGSDIKKSFGERKENIAEINEAKDKGEQGFTRSLLQKGGQALGFASDVIGSTVMGAVKALTPQGIQEKAGEVVGSGVKKVAETETAQKLVGWYSNLDEKTKRDVDAALGTASLVTDVAGGALLKKPVTQAVQKTADVAVDVAKNVARVGTEKIGGAIDVAKTLVKGTGEVIRSGAETIKQIPSKVAVNVAEKQAERKLIQSLPSKVAQDAVAKGINIDDAKFVTSIKPQSKPLYKKLFSSVEKFDAGISDKNPVEIIGKPIVDSFQKLKTNANTVGKQLGDVADNMGIVSKPELTDGVFNALKQVNGLTGLKLNRKGALDFSNTTLASSLTKSDRKAIQEAFNQATKWGNAKKAHQFRQELFEVLGGKKKGGVQITDTQDKAYQAIRKGLSDVLETKNPQYKKLSNEYRKLVQPIQDINNMFRAKGLDEDILQLKAGTIMRRLTSNAPSKAELQQLLRNVDKVLGRSSKAKVSSEDLQNFYNILERYYPNITNETSFKGQLTSGIEATGMTDALIKSVKGFAGETDAVRKQALKDLLKEVLK